MTINSTLASYEDGKNSANTTPNTTTSTTDEGESEENSNRRTITRGDNAATAPAQTTDTASGASASVAAAASTSTETPPSSASTTPKKTEISISETQGVRLGKCKWFNVAKGWGFIRPNDGGQDVFVHQSVIQMAGFRSLGEQEEVEFECKLTERGLEATHVSAPGGIECRGSTFRPKPKKRFRRIRCYNCGAFANHIASKCALGPQPKRCHFCKSEDHLVADCPNKKAETQAAQSEDSNHEDDDDDDKQLSEPTS